MKAKAYITKIGHLTMVKNDGGNDYHIFIDNEYQGRVVKLNNHWIGHLDEDSDLTIDEIRILGRIIEQKLARAV